MTSEITPRAEYLAANPQAAALEAAQITEICACIGAWFHWYSKAKTHLIDGGEFARQIGMKINAYADTLPGKKFTDDFWQQIQHKFTTPDGRQISMEMLKWYAKVSRDNATEITSIFQVPKMSEVLLLGETEWEAAKSRAPKVLRVPESPYNRLYERMQVGALEHDWEEFCKDPRFGGGDVRQLKQTRPDLCYEFVKTADEQVKFWSRVREVLA